MSYIYTDCSIYLSSFVLKKSFFPQSSSLDYYFYELFADYHKDLLFLHYRTRRQGSRVGDDILERRLLGALVLALRNLANSLIDQKQSNSRCHGICKLYPIVMLLLPVNGKEYGNLVIYMHIGVGSALLVSISRAMREPLSVRRVTGTGSHAFLIYE